MYLLVRFSTFFIVFSRFVQRIDFVELKIGTDGDKYIPNQ